MEIGVCIITVQSIFDLIGKSWDAINGISWQVVALILFFSLYSKLKEAISRIKRFKLGHDGLDAEMNPAAQQKAIEQVERPNGEIKLKDFPNLPRTEAIQNVELFLHDAIKSVRANDQVDLLIRNLAQARLESVFGRIYAGIFGSQIRGLIELKAIRQVSAQEAFEFYKPFGDKHPEIYASYGFSGWLDFLKNFGLVEAVGDNIRITNVGDDFVQWLYATKLSLDKAW